MRFAVIVAVTLLLAAFACGEELTPTAGPKATSAPASPATTPAPGSNPALGSEALTASSDIRSFQLQDLVVQLGTTVKAPGQTRPVPPTQRPRDNLAGLMRARSGTAEASGAPGPSAILLHRSDNFRISVRFIRRR